VEAREIVVREKVKGDLHGRERVQIGSSGSVVGSVVTRRVVVEEGAELRGHLDNTRAEERRPARVTPIASSAGSSEGRPAHSSSSVAVKEPAPTI
jgi:cytoskeletal protein CcmA (bactofilin family)